MKIEGNQKELDAMVEFHKGNRVEGLRLMSELTEHTLANEIEAPHEILRK